MALSACDLDVKAASVALRAERAKLTAAEVAVKAAKLRVDLAKLNRDLTKECRLLKTLQQAHENCGSGAAPSQPADQELKESTPDEEVALAEQRLAAVRDQEQQAKQEVAAARNQVLDLQRQTEEQQRLILDTILQQADLRSAHRECLMTPQHPYEATWQEERLRLSAKAMRHKAGLAPFLSKLTMAPCLRSLTVCLDEPRYGEPLPALPLLLHAVEKAPARIKELSLTFGKLCKDVAFALMELTQLHLERLEVRLLDFGFDLADEDLSRLWRVLDGSNIKSLALSSEQLVRGVAYPFPASKLRLERLDVGAVGESRRSGTVLVPLLQAARGTLRAVHLPRGLRQDERGPVFKALEECRCLEEASVPCYQDIARLRSCAKVKSLHLHCVDAAWSGVRQTDEAVKLLSLRSVSGRLSALSLHAFSEEKDRGLFQALVSLRRLRNLTLDCMEFSVLRNLAEALPWLEELHLLRGFYLDPEVLPKIKPALLPNLTLLELDCCELDDDEECESWQDAVFDLRMAFHKVNPDFVLKDSTRYFVLESTYASEDSDVDSGDQGDGSDCQDMQFD